MALGILSLQVGHINSWQALVIFPTPHCLSFHSFALIFALIKIKMRVGLDGARDLFQH